MCKIEPDFDYFGEGLDGYMQYMDTFDEAFNADDTELDDEIDESDMENEEIYFDEEDYK